MSWKGGKKYVRNLRSEISASLASRRTAFASASTATGFSPYSFSPHAATRRSDALVSDRSTRASSTGRSSTACFPCGACLISSCSFTVAASAPFCIAFGTTCWTTTPTADVTTSSSARSACRSIREFVLTFVC